MPKFFFRVECRGQAYQDEAGEVFPTAAGADDHARRIAAELGRDYKEVTVQVLNEQGTEVLRAITATLPPESSDY